MSKPVREVTDNVISAVEDGFLSWETVAKAALRYMSEDDVADMAQANDWALFPDEDEKICPECGEDLGEDGRCYNLDCDQYDPLSQYFDDDEEDEEYDDDSEEEEEDSDSSDEEEHGKKHQHKPGRGQKKPTAAEAQQCKQQ